MGIRVTSPRDNRKGVVPLSTFFSGIAFISRIGILSCNISYTGYIDWEFASLLRI